jgi:hypothetical protein
MAKTGAQDRDKVRGEVRGAWVWGELFIMNRESESWRMEKRRRRVYYAVESGTTSHQTSRISNSSI